MKHLILIPLLFIAACAARPNLVVKPAPQPSVEPLESVRYSEVVRAYNVGRFVDPNNPEMMHEQHPIYRIETSARWNLHPGASGLIRLLNPPPDAASVAPLTNDVLVAEMNRQREATAQVMSQAVRLSRSYEELQKFISEMRAVARNNAVLNARLTEAEQQVAAVAREIESLSTSSTARASQSTEFHSDPIESPKP